MRKFITKIALFLFSVVIVDFLVGLVFDSLQAKAKGGMTKRDYYICNELQTDVLLCGSSRCVRHYNPQIISDSLGLSCYNIGQFGNGIILQYGRLNLIKRNMNPKLVIYDIYPGYDLLEGTDNHRDITWLKPYYDQDEIKEIFATVDHFEKYKMLSKMYSYNSHFLEILVDYIHPIVGMKDDGFIPLNGSKLRAVENQDIEKNYSFDPVKIKYMEKYMEILGNKLVLCVSPIWYGMDPSQLTPLIELCKKYNIELIDYSNAPKYLKKDEYFHDVVHLNSIGADEFTRDLLQELKNRGIYPN